MYTFEEIKKIILKENGRPKQISSNVYTDDIKDWIMVNIKGNSTLQGKLWCIAHNLYEVPNCANPKCNNNTKYHNKFNEGFRKFCGDPKCIFDHPETKEKYKSTSLKNWGTEHPLLNKHFREELKNIVEERHGSKYAMQSSECKEKYKSTSLKNWGTEHPLMSTEVQNKIKNSLLINIGYEYPAQNYDIMKRIMDNRKCRTVSYNERLYYQGKYELYFLNEMERLGYLDYIENGLTFKYDFLNKTRLYVSDFYIPLKNEIIEIKSHWTYNKRGTDKTLENKNIAKKNKVLELGYNFKFLIDYSEIDNYIKTFTNNE